MTANLVASKRISATTTGGYLEASPDGYFGQNSVDGDVLRDALAFLEQCDQANAKVAGGHKSRALTCVLDTGMRAFKIKVPNFWYFWLAFFVALAAWQPETTAAQADVPDEPPSSTQAMVSTAVQVPFDPEANQPLPTLAEAAARTPAAIRALTANEAVEYEALMRIALSADPGVHQDEKLAAGAKALKLKEATYGPDHPETLATLTAIGSHLFSQAHYAEAEPILKRAWQVSVLTMGDQHPETLSSLVNYAYTLQSLNRFGEAEPLYSTALRLQRALPGDHHAEERLILTYYALNLQMMGDRMDEAAQMFSDALPLYEDLEALLNEVLAPRVIKFNEKDDILIQKSGKVLGERSYEILGMLAAYGFALQFSDQIDETTKVYSEFFTRARDFLDARHPISIMAETTAAQLLIKKGDLVEAEPLLNELMRLNRDIFGDYALETIISRISYADLLREMGKLNEAEPLYADAIPRLRTVLGKRYSDIRIPLSNYASLFILQNRAIEAEPMIAEALKLTREAKGERDPETLALLTNYASVLAFNGKFIESEKVLSEALRLHVEIYGKDHYATQPSLISYANLLTRLGRQSEVEPLLSDTLRAFYYDKISASALEALASAFSAMGRTDEADKLFVEALEVISITHGKNSPGEIFLSLELALNRLKENSLADQAIPHARFALNKLRLRHTETGSFGVRGEAQQNRQRGELHYAERIFLDAAWVRKNRFPKEAKSLLYESFTTLQGASSDAVTRAIAQTAGRRYAESVGADSLIAERAKLVEQWAISDRKHTNALANSTPEATEQREQMEIDLVDFDAQIRAIDADIEMWAPEYFSIVNQPPLDLYGAQAMLAADEAVLMIVPSSFGTHIMALTRDTLEWHRADYNEVMVAEMVTRLRRDLDPSQPAASETAIQRPEDDYLRFDRALAHDLYEALIAPIEPVLHGKQTVYIAADGALAGLPFGVLVTESPSPGTPDYDLDVMRETPWFADAYALVQIPSLQSLAYLRKFNQGGLPVVDDARAMTFAGFGDPLLNGVTATRGGRSGTLFAVDAATLTGRGVTDAGAPLMDPSELRKMARLPGTAQELETVRNLLGASPESLKMVNQMTEAAIRSADLSKVRVLHLATHGLTASESGRRAEPGLVFTPPEQASNEDDGFLAASEVLSLDLAGTEWVILSACNTAAPSGKAGEAGLSGLARAFFYAGAPSLLVSHWPVYDSVAAELTVNALTRTIKGESRAKALQGAMRDIRNQIDRPEFAHPGAWAPFTLAGEGR